MTREDVINELRKLEYYGRPFDNSKEQGEKAISKAQALAVAIQILEQEPCDMTAEEYRQRMIQAFRNADCDELIAVCVLPTEKEFEHLEWLLKTHYKKEPCENEERQFFEVMEFPETFNEFAEQYGFTDKEEYYTNGSQLISVFRVKQWLEHKALEQEPCEDCISRESLLNKAVYAEFADGVKGWVIEKGYVEDLPSVQPKQKTGHWIRVSMDKYVQHAMAYYKCSECGGEIIGEYNYCPNCGKRVYAREGWLINQPPIKEGENECHD